MINVIGSHAGQIWKYLDQNGELSIAGLIKGTQLKQRDADRAIGWLAREGKIDIFRKRNAEYIQLKV